MFYIVVDNKKIKVIKEDLFLLYGLYCFGTLDYGDGSKRNEGVTLCTDKLLYPSVVFID